MAVCMLWLRFAGLCRCYCIVICIFNNGVCGVCRSCLVSLCIFTVWKVLLMSKRYSNCACRWYYLIESLAIELLMLYSVVIVEWPSLRPDCVMMCCMLSVMYGRRPEFGQLLR